jgi:hypothetical protein
LQRLTGPEAEPVGWAERTATVDAPGMVFQAASLPADPHSTFAMEGNPRTKSADDTMTPEEVLQLQKAADTRFDILIRNAQQIVATEERRRPSMYETIPGREEAVSITVIENRLRPREVIPPPKAPPVTLPARRVEAAPEESPEELRQRLLAEPENIPLRQHYLEYRTQDLFEADCRAVSGWRIGLVRWALLVAIMVGIEAAVVAALVIGGLQIGELAGGLVGSAVAAVLCGLISWKLFRGIAGANELRAEWAELGPLPANAYWMSLQGARQKYLGQQ